MNWILNALRRRLNAPVIKDLRRLQQEATVDAYKAGAWDGVPADIMARLTTLDEVIGIVEADRR